MNFAESAVSSIDISATTAEVGPLFAEIMRDVLREKPFASKIELLVFFPTILAPEMGAMPDRVTYKRSEPSVFIQMNISHASWVESDRLGRLRLYVDALCRGIEQVRSSTLSDLDKGTLLTVARQAQDEFFRRAN